MLQVDPQLILTTLVVEKICIDVKGSLHWSIGHDLSLYLLNITGDTIGTLAIVLVLNKGVSSVVSLVGKSILYKTEGKLNRDCNI